MSADLKEFTDDLSKVKLFANPEELATRPLDNVAFYDFAFHNYLFNPEDGFSLLNLSKQAIEFITELENQNGLSHEESNLIAHILELFENAVYKEIARKYSGITVDQLGGVFREIYFYAASRRIIIIINASKDIENAGGDDNDISAIFRKSTANALDWEANLTSERFGDILSNGIEGDAMLFSLGHLYVPVEFTNNQYKFDIFPVNSINIGLRLLYRQEWKPLGSQPGEIVRTIPLGPGQKDRVTIKIVRRQKRTSTLETQTESETTTESTDSAKDSSEIVNEAKETSNWNETLEIGGSFLGISADSTTTFGGSSEQQSKNTASHLSETMRKTSSKLRRQTKVVVSTESEVSFEQENYSEIINPNNEIAITYEYHKLQQQYEVFTYLAEVQSVIYVAEEVPAPLEVNEDWVRKHDWILAKVLKDESHRATLNELIQDADEESPSDAPFLAMHTAAYDNFAKFDQGAAQGQQGLSIPDIYGEPQRIYQQHLRDNVARKRANVIRERKRNRLYQHFRDNILYYCRAIWIHEDSDQRLLRYKKEGRRVPVEWQAPLISAVGQPRQFTPTGVTAPLGDVIDPTGPIGYSGNYAVFLLRPRPRVEAKTGSLIGRLGNKLVLYSLEDVLADMRDRYHNGDGVLEDPALTAFHNEAINLQQKKPEKFNAPTDNEIVDILSYIPRLGRKILNGQTNRVVGYEPDALETLPISTDDYGEYLYRKNGTRRFLVDSNNLYLNIRVSEGAALESFKRAHRYIDVLKEYENYLAVGHKNTRRVRNLDAPSMFDPDIEKAVIVGSGVTATQTAMSEGLLGSGTAAGSGAPNTGGANEGSADSSVPG